MGFLEFGYETSPNMADTRGKHVVLNVEWIWNFESRELAPASVLQIGAVDSGFMERIMSRDILSEKWDVMFFLVCCRHESGVRL